ncbi:phosphotransferase enzyme family protein [Pontibacter liquoris]|uniref:phosphotransferase enzyme family protein n=1 Tax=Pontibacter liquoris TaxID=2905677 RepID=UPI001FA78496|nr:aminoglycoside phosphotransferase family protein [Pontibacter liquoris]
MLHEILTAFGLDAENFTIQKLSSGLINHTWKVTGPHEAYILQQINAHVFRSPQDIADNIVQIGRFLDRHAPAYLFVSPIATATGAVLVQNQVGDYFRLSLYVSGSRTIDTVTNRQQAFEAARQFGRFTRLLHTFDAATLKYTLPDFHNLALRYQQLEQAHAAAPASRLADARQAITDAFAQQHLVQTYEAMVADPRIPKRVIHHDTKISNVLFDQHDKGLCVIDLDTVMPGYFISDLGDMMRTYLSPANEEVQDLTKVTVREDYFRAIIEGYFTEMADVLTEAEKELLLYAGKFMIYMQAIRFLADFLNGDTYYATTYAGQNLVRAQNQFMLLRRYTEAELRFTDIVRTFRKEKS